MSGITLDSGGLIGLERGDRRVGLLLTAALKSGARIIVPATVVAQVLRNPAKQVRLWRLLQNDSTEIVPLDAQHAQAIGVLLAKSGTADIVDAHVVICARESGYAVVTSDLLDMRRLDPTIQTIVV